MRRNGEWPIRQATDAEIRAEYGVSKEDWLAQWKTLSRQQFTAWKEERRRAQKEQPTNGQAQ